jgi:hypothetical protein
MSLQHVAKHLEQQGRGPDSALVHMSNKELAGLQALAQKHGKSLTINPHTGLPEAGILDSFLPAALGIGTAIFAPELLPFVAGAGGLYDYAKTGDLGKGVMTGASIWGAGSLAGGFAEAGSQMGIEKAGETTASNFANAPVTAPNTASSMTEGLGGAEEAAKESAANAAKQSASNYINAQNFPNLSADQIANMQANATADTVRGAGMANQAMAPATSASRAASMGQGISSLNSAGSVLAAHPAAALSTVAPMFMQQQQQTAPDLQSQQAPSYKGARLSPDFKGYQPPQPDPAYQAQYRDYVKNPYTNAAEGGLMSLSGGGDINEKQKTKKPTHTAAAKIAMMPAWDAAQAELNNNFYMAQSPTGVASLPSAAPLGALTLAGGGTVEQMSRENAMGNNQMFPQAGLGGLTGMNSFQNATNTPMGTNVIEPTDAITDPYTGAMKFAMGGDVGGEYNLGSYSDGGRLLKGPGDGMSDNIPAKIGKHQPARLADGEFVIPADVVSGLGNGSTDAGAKRLYAMMNKVRKARTGTAKQGKQINADKYIPV